MNRKYLINMFITIKNIDTSRTKKAILSHQNQLPTMVVWMS